MRPWEETWRVRNSTGCQDCVYCEDPKGYVLRPDDDGPREEACVRLAAAAPEMARLLLELEWAGWNGEGADPGGDCCPACGGDDSKVRSLPNVHTETCTLVAVLRKAGVLE